MKAAIIVDSTAGISQELHQQADVYQVDLTIHFPDGSQISDTTDEDINQEFYEKIKTSHQLPTTSQPQIGLYYELMDDLIDEGYDTIYAIHLSGAISGTYQSAKLIQQEYKSKVNMYVINTRSASIVMHELVIRTLSMIEDSNISPDAIFDQLQWIVDHAYLQFMVQDLFNLTKGGRLSYTGALVGSMLKIHPILTFNEAGELSLSHKIRTTKKVMKHFQEMVADAKDKFPQGFTVAIAHSNALKLANELKVIIDDILPENQTCRVDILTPVLGTHTGEGLFGLGIIPNLPEQR